MTEQILYSYVYVDEPHLSEICINIISNAVKYTDAGGTISCKIAQRPCEKEDWCIVEVATDGVACISMIEKADADYYKMILMDIQMPVMDGFDTTLTIRKMKDDKKAMLPIIAMTANAFAEDRQKALSVGMNDHVAKPVDMNILAPTMMKYL